MTTNPEPTPLSDVHAHFLTPRCVRAAQDAGNAQPDGMAAFPTWQAFVHLELMDQWGVATSLLSISSPSVHFGDDAAAGALSRHVNEAGPRSSAKTPPASGTSPQCRCPTWTAPWPNCSSRWTNRTATGKSRNRKDSCRLSPLPDMVGPASETPGTHSGQRLRSVRQPKSAAGDALTVILARKW